MCLGCLTGSTRSDFRKADDEVMAASVRSASSGVLPVGGPRSGRLRTESDASGNNSTRGRSVVLVPATDLDADFAAIAKYCYAKAADLNGDAKQRLLWDFGLVQSYTADEYAKLLSKYKPRPGERRWRAWRAWRERA